MNQPAWIAPTDRGDAAQLGLGIQRTMTLLATSMPRQRNTVRLLFYGQSITEQDWWKQVVADLRQRFPHANLIAENRALGGYASQLLVKTAETDLYPFQPDLLIFHVFGAHNTYEDIIRRTRERTTAEILIQTDHVNATDNWRTEETNPAKVTMKDWSSFMNYQHLPSVIQRYGCGFVDQRNLWKRYLRQRGIEAQALLRDGVHLNDDGCRLMAAFTTAALVRRSAPAQKIDPMNCGFVRTYRVGREVSARAGVLRLDFEGSRVDLIGEGSRAESAALWIDGKKPSEYPELYVRTRATAQPGGKWPPVAPILSEALPLLEEWTMDVHKDPAKDSLFTFSLRGSRTGEDGAGRSDQRFVSKSRRVVLMPESWDVAYALALAQVKPIPEHFSVTWRVVAGFQDTWQPAVVAPGIENVTTVAQGLTDTKHVLEVKGGLSGLRAIRIYSPKAFPTRTI